MIIELVGIRGAGKSTIHSLLKKELERRGWDVANCRTWDKEIRTEIRGTGFQGDLKGESGFQKNVHLSSVWECFQKDFPVTALAYETAVKRIGTLSGEGPAKRMMTGRKYFARWYRATLSTRTCLWDKGLLQVMAKLLLHEQQWRRFEWEEVCAQVMPHWPVSDLYIDLIVSPQISFERSKNRSKKQWNWEDHKDADYVFSHLMGWLPNRNVLQIYNEGSPQEAVKEIVDEIDGSDRSQ